MFSDLESTDRPPTPVAAVSDRGKFRNCANCTTRMPSIVFDAHTLCIGCKDQACNMSVHCYECRDWSDSYRLAFLEYTALLRLGVIRKCGVRLGLVLRSLIRISLFAMQTQMCLLLMNQYLQFRFKVIK